MANTQGFNFIKIGGIWFFRWQKPPIRGLTITERTWNYGNLPYLVASTQGFNFIKIGGIWIFWGTETPIRRLTLIEKCWNYGNLPYLVANTYGLNFIKIGGIWIFRGPKIPYLGKGLHVTCDAHLRTWPSYCSQKSCVKIWFGLIEPSYSYCVHKHPKKKKKNHRCNWKRYASFGHIIR